VPVDDLICAQDDDEISASDLSNVRAFRDGARDSATISAPTLYEDEFDYDSIDHPSDRPPERIAQRPLDVVAAVAARQRRRGRQQRRVRRIGLPQGPATVGLVDSNGGPRFSDDDLTRMRTAAPAAPLAARRLPARATRRSRRAPSCCASARTWCAKSTKPSASTSATCTSCATTFSS
jgi:hypothetical protein